MNEPLDSLNRELKDEIHRSGNPRWWDKVTSRVDPDRHGTPIPMARTFANEVRAREYFVLLAHDDDLLARRRRLVKAWDEQRKQLWQAKHKKVESPKIVLLKRA